MRKILLVIQREYLTRVKKKSFWILTLIVPILLVSLYAIPIYLAINSLEVTHVAVVDETGVEQAVAVQFVGASSDAVQEQVIDVVSLKLLKRVLEHGL